MFNFEVYAYLLKIKSKIPDFERGKAIRLRRINHRNPAVAGSRGLKFDLISRRWREADKRRFRKGAF